MPSLIPEPLEALTVAFGRLPGIGPKTAQRLAFHALIAPREESARLASALSALHDRVGLCPTCFFLCDNGRCPLCSDTQRDGTILCVVEDPLDVLAVERSGEFHGRYHVLGGSLSPLEGRGPESLHMTSLETRVAAGDIREVVVATDSDVEGEATAHWVADRLGPTGVTVSRLAHGLPAGGSLGYADEVTVARALAGRRPLTG